MPDIENQQPENKKTEKVGEKTPYGAVQLEVMSKRNKATAIYKKTGDSRVVARYMSISVKEAYRLIKDGLDDDLREIQGLEGKDWSALNMREYLKLKTRLDGMIDCAGVLFDDYYNKIKDKNVPEDKKPRYMPRELSFLINEARKLLESMDKHLVSTGKFVRKTEMHFSWDNPNLMDDPEFQNFMEAIKDFLKKKGIDPIEFIEHMDEMSRKATPNIDDIGAQEPVHDVNFEDVTDLQSEDNTDTE